VPDIYQGGELWDFSLVDPDNRRPVDWEMRRILLHEIAGASLGDLAANWQDGREKLFISYRLLELRRRHPALFAEGDYQPIEGWSPKTPIGWRATSAASASAPPIRSRPSSALRRLR
jgi:maltooligosyltrehalose synthase